MTGPTTFAGVGSAQPKARPHPPAGPQEADPMAHLTLAGVSDDGKRLLLVSDEGAEFTLDIDQSLRAALRGDASRLGQLEIQMDSSLRPRDIQARIRAGESPEAVAQSAQTSVERVMVYAGPVLAEREHVAQRAQRSSVRRGSGEGGARILGDAVEAHLHSLNVDPETVEWDAWRREDGRWALRATFTTLRRSGTAELTYDAPGSYVLLDNEDARWLVGEAVAERPAAAEPRDDLRQARSRRLSAVPADELPLGDDVLELLKDDDPAPLGSGAPVEAFLDDSPASDDPELREEATEAAVANEPEAGPAADEPPSRKPKKRGRASVPSWDEIMFGGSDQ
ncbi:septation protein SepH [Nocardioides sp. cx-169]|uniref:septation protein SepH n=1 Tax=Nocardioides sp. cx-169 TaxID=2899080 RepID=UPI0027DF6DE1|nr:septation protein SepH [Nocardioides sp. cx-169]